MRLVFATLLAGFATLAFAAATLPPAKASTCTTTCYGSGSYRTCNTSCF